MRPSSFTRHFVYLHDIDPTIRISLRYVGSENFIGRPIHGYEKPVAVLTIQAAEALKKVQADVQKDGYSLVIYDAYRPQRSVNHFIQWAEDASDQAQKAYYYPRVDKSRVFELGYVAKRSSHSRGSTVDVTIIEVGTSLHPVTQRDRVLRDGFTIKLLDDGTVDMGSSFDLFDEASHPESMLVDECFQERRRYLKNSMEKHGFKVSPVEWWHFTLKDEPFVADMHESYFDFMVE